MGHQASGRSGRHQASAIGAHYRHTTPEMAARVVAAVEERLVIVLATAEARPRPNNLVALRAGVATVRRLLAGCWQMALRAEGEDALCLVELRGFEPLTPCMPCSFGLV